MLIIPKFHLIIESNAAEEQKRQALSVSFLDIADNPHNRFLLFCMISVFCINVTAVTKLISQRYPFFGTSVPVNFPQKIT